MLADSPPLIPGNDLGRHININMDGIERRESAQKVFDESSNRGAVNSEKAQEVFDTTSETRGSPFDVVSEFAPKDIIRKGANLV